MAELYAIAEGVIVAVVVLAAVAYLGLHWSGALAKWRARKKPDVKVGALVRKKNEARGEDDCCR